MRLADPEAAKREVEERPGGDRSTCYRLGARVLALRSDREEILRRFDDRFRDCLTRPRPGEPIVEYDMRHSQDGSVVLVSVSGEGSFSQLDFALPLYALEGYRMSPGPPGWRMIHPGGGDATVAVSDRHLVADGAQPWQRFVTNLAINHVLGLQAGILFFHAAGVVIGDRALLILGPKGAGKTTLALALAARGHRCLGDEIVGVDASTLEVVAVRRALSIRPGFVTDDVSTALAGHRVTLEHLSDGTERRRLRLSEVFPASVDSPATLDAILILDGRGREVTAERIEPGFDDLPRFAPLGCSLWFGPPAPRAMQLLRLIPRVRCFSLEAGSPEATSTFLEDLMAHA